jgi:DnaJ-domain-containing protein 1
MNGQLTDHPLAELIHEISDARLSGALRLAHERVRGAVYFAGGQIVSALSNLRALRLVEILRRTGAADESRLGAILREEMSDEKAGLALLRAGILDEAALKSMQDWRSKEVLRELLRWTEGEWSFDPRVRLVATHQVGLVDAAGLLIESARNFPVGFISARMRNVDDKIAPAAGAQERVGGGLRLLPTEAFILSRIYEPSRLGDVVNISGLPVEETRRAIYVLALGGLLERSGWPRALSSEVLRQAAQRPAAVADEATPVAETAQPEKAKAQTPEAEPDTRGTVEELFERASGSTHYEVLGVKRSAETDEVKRAYYSHARRLHPDRFRRDADEDLRQRIDAAFAKIAQAYDTLKDSGTRAAYDLKLLKKRGGAG